MEAIKQADNKPKRGRPATLTAEEKKQHKKESAKRYQNKAVEAYRKVREAATLAPL